MCARRKLVYDELHARAKEEAAKEEKRKRRAREAFGALLREQRDIGTSTPWEDVRSKLEDAPEFKAVRAALSYPPSLLTCLQTKYTCSCKVGTRCSLKMACVWGFAVA